jgi:predicted transcriptional regulator
VPTQQMRAIWHPTRARILELVMAGPKTQSQIVKAVGGPLAKVAYHSKVLCRAGCIQRAGSSSSDSDDPLYEVV